MSTIRIRDAAELLGVSDDTVRRWIDHGTLPATQDKAGRKVIAGDVLAKFLRTNAPHRHGIHSASPAQHATASSA